MAFELVGLDLVDFPSADPGRGLVVPVLVLVGFNTPGPLLGPGGRARAELRGLKVFRLVLELYLRFLIELGTDTVAAAAGFCTAG